ncbi:MAG: T9SS type A sorting domain-containing protein [Vicingaceae bacterium]|nr:T9SS type A sorting domain-containing protein [Vicingaceae bacterium]
MNIKSILIGSFALGLAVGGTLLVQNQEQKNAYTPRVNSALTSQAGYAEYMHMLRQDPATGIVDPALVNKVRSEVMSRSKVKNKASLGLNWQPQGPDNVGGRTRAILIDRNNSNIVYAGSVTGGLFVSTDASLSWTPVSGMQGLLGQNLAVSCITQTANGRVFFGTGSTFESSSGNGGSGAIGNGVYEYIPSTGAVVPVITNTTAVPNNNSSSQWSYTNAIGSYGNRLYLGTGSGMVYADPNGSGAYPTTLGSWTNPLQAVPGLPETGRVQDIDVASDGTMLVSFGGRAYVSNQGDNNFVKVGAAMLTGGSRWSGAIAPSNPEVMYMLRSNTTLRGLSVSVDRGITWSEIVPAGVSTGTPSSKDPFVQNDGTGGQGGYDDAIAVNPGDWGHVIVGGVQLYEWRQNGSADPTLGSWLKSAVLSEFAGSFYVHADKHTVVWQDANTVYIGSDGGVTKSSDGAATWQGRNLGYDVTSFYDISLAANGYIVGGAQDNGTQMVTFGDFGVVTPLGAFEIQGGDGFDACFSNFGEGIAFATSQFGSLQRYSGTSGGSFYNTFLNNHVSTVGQPFHTVIQNWENENDMTSKDSVEITFSSIGTVINPGDTVFLGDTIFQGETISYTSLTNGIDLSYTVPADIIIDTSPDTLKLIDPIQNKFVTRVTDGIYYTQDAARLNALSYNWFKIAPDNNVENFEFSRDGNYLFMGTSNGRVIRIGGLSSLTSVSTQAQWDAVLSYQVIATGLGGGGVVGLSSDPNDANNLIATVSGYNTQDHVYRCVNALTASSNTGNFTSIQGALPKMPVFDAQITYFDNDKVIIGTEWGVWTTDNAFSAVSGAAVQWTDESGNGMSHVPVFAIEQQYLESWRAVNSGHIYLGTHGRGFYKSTDLGGINVSVEENEAEFSESEGFASSLNVYPNPMNNNGALSFKINENVETTINIYNLTGSLVKTIELGMKAMGEHTERFDASDLSVGSYVISLESGSERKVAKFIVTR